MKKALLLWLCALVSAGFTGLCQAQPLEQPSKRPSEPSMAQPIAQPTEQPSAAAKDTTVLHVIKEYELESAPLGLQKESGLVFVRLGELSYCLPAEAIDTLGAGDSFAAAFLVNYYNFLEADPDSMIPGSDYYQRAIHDCLDAAAEFSSATCLVRGAFGHGKTIDPDTYTAHMKEPGFVR